MKEFLLSWSDFKSFESKQAARHGKRRERQSYNMYSNILEDFMRVLKLFYSEKRSESLTGIEP